MVLKYRRTARATRCNPSPKHPRAILIDAVPFPHSVANIELQLHHRSARLVLLLLDLGRELAEMYHLSRRCLIGAATTASRRGSASSGQHALRRLAAQPRAQGVEQTPLTSEVQEALEHSGPFPSRRRGDAVDRISLRSDGAVLLKRWQAVVASFSRLSIAGFPNLGGVTSFREAPPSEW